MANPSLRWSPIVQFVSEAGRWAVASAVAAVISACLGIWEHATDHPVSAFILLCPSVPLFWTGAVVVVAKQRKELEGMKAGIARLKAHPPEYENQRTENLTSRVRSAERILGTARPVRVTEE